MKLAPRFSARLCVDDSGATAIEYGLLAALIALGITGSVVALGSSIDASFGTITATLSAESTGSDPDAGPEPAPTRKNRRSSRRRLR